MSAKNRRSLDNRFFQKPYARYGQRSEDLTWEEIPHYILYSLTGFVLGLSSPIGAFLLRYWISNPTLFIPWALGEIKTNSLFYSYMTIGTSSVFMAFGYLLGLRSETQNVRAHAMRTRLSELRLKSVTDSLTGAYSHGYLQETLKLEVEKAIDSNQPLSIALIDLDDFKKINDGRGHLFGDRTVKETAETISTSIRAEDVLGRYGGDEFLVIMPKTDLAVATIVAERIRRNIAKNPYLATVSIGLSSFKTTEKSEAHRMIEEADRNLYRAKRQGKNKIGTEDPGSTSKNAA